MDRLIAHNGGMPLELDDLMFIQNAFKGALKGVLHEFVKTKNGNVILSGCQVTNLGGGNYSLSTGYAMLDYEIVYVPAQTTNFIITALVFDLSYDPNGNDVFFDGATRDTYEKRQAKAYDPNTTLPSSYVLMSDENRLTYLMPEAMKSNWALTDFVGKKYVFQPSDFIGGATPSTSYPPYVIKKNGRVSFYGAVNVPSNISPGTNIITLPTDFRKGLSIAGGFADIYLCSYGSSIIRLGVSPTQLKYFDVVVAGSAIGYDISLNQISYDIDNI